jgi:hypothetical protein
MDQLSATSTRASGATRSWLARAPRQR